ncbi:MAG: hypothetical protein NG737_06720 [Omnitrophica bacterium]|nr:hypothetical protein [Candidatus Omnitrophota bacterium]
MDVKLESLIEKIRKDGVEEAQKTATEIIDKAQQKATSIINQANTESDAIVKQAEAQAQKLKSNTENSLKQAARDLVLALREQINKLFDKILKRKISEELSPEYLKELILSLVSKWSPKDGEVIEVLVAKNEQKKLVDLIFSQIKKEARDRIELKVSGAVSKGFRIGIKGDAAYYDFTDESILESLKVFLNPAISAMLDSSNG